MATAKKNKTGAGGRSNRRFIVLLVLLALSVAGSAVIFAYLGSVQGHDKKYLEITRQQSRLSDRISRYAMLAVRGRVSDPDAGTGPFQALLSAKTAFSHDMVILQHGDPARGLPAAPAATRPAIGKVRGLWRKLDRHLQVILSGRGYLPKAHGYAATLDKLLPGMGSKLLGLAGQAHGSRARVLERQVVRVQRINQQIDALVHAGGGRTPSGKQLKQSIGTLGTSLQELSHGNPSKELTAPASARERQALDALLGDYQKLSGQGGYIAAHADGLVKAQQALAGLAIEPLQNALAQQEQAFREVMRDRPVKATYGLALAALAAVLLVMAIYSMTSQIRRLLRNAREQNSRNQDAILQLLDEMGTLAEGDLTVQASVSEDITGAIADSINYAIEALRDLVTTINTTAERVATAASESRDNASRLIRASEQQSGQINATSGAIENMAHSIGQVSENAQRSAKVAQQSVQTAAKGGTAVRRTIEGMDSIREQIQETSKRIKRLGESSQEIGNIVELINDIAEQTNILALNAAIQASAAGEQGRGFAVVADEVQRLAERSTNATKQIEALVRTIQADTNEAVTSMENSTSGVVAGAKLAEDAGNALDEIERVSNQIASLVQSISDAARQQSRQAAEVTSNMTQIQKVTQETAEGTRETGDAIGRLAELATELRESVAGFKLP
ncbi:MAG TPA: methyl-accepting chemotaxis protein [Gammaproteobacteria bacterium]|nr:methyl-accepting chemotaxis protein [Gammaproteobacteria bacterium]